MYADQPDCLELVETLSEKVKSLYEAEVCLFLPFLLSSARDMFTC